MELVEYVEVGMPIIVSPGLKDTKVNMAEGYDIPWISTNGKPIYKYVHIDTVAKVDSLVKEIVVDTAKVVADTAAVKNVEEIIEVVDSIKE
jgi:hypothetical protein